ncbi:TPT-domain-containing protein [Metschnikowia bicuspidata var. bicuspidata NRRL YB-4993]|uniref:TPT-domain-containing protein n=1 Tax=Metschnikowia bicuspidata var. bicuspidata NRRL YB-4993 TaxID=869754 RepID=A0A1A0H831_9ASCO|nr:TPT-domain-containing protein [Metschnikowia bicuspidata var. bicuspidata NRRL YB-4993]OBA20259.1 TPT-domain-containing protein [Metschnikowia bicuspidata var. bicuspidata NRRL YB-4993]
MSMSSRQEAPGQNSRLAALYIAGWYLFSVSISVYNKWMFGSGLNFRFPLFVTAFHQTCLFILSVGVLYFRPGLRPGANKASQTFRQSLAMPLKMYAAQILPCALASAGDIGLSNVALKYISLSLYTMLKTSSLVFVLLFGLLLRLERFNWRLVVIVVVMCASVMMMTEQSGKPAETTDNGSQPLGVVLILAASAVSGLRWSFTQLLLKNNEYTKHPMQTILYISPSMTAALFVFGLIFEGWQAFTALPMWVEKGVCETTLLMVAPGILAFCMTLCEFQLLSVAQILTLSVAGIFKELLTIMLGSLIFGDTLSPLNCAGLVITFLDILWYNYFRYTEPDAPAKNGYAALQQDSESQARALESIELKQH